ncbi:MAG: RING finger protein [Simkaniaceae bacterium]|nr:RING finger protein [Candidatus Sacchlamyda saccharinae]
MTNTVDTTRIPTSQLPAHHSCGICLKDSDSRLDPWVKHTGLGGDAHPIHYYCFKKSLQSNPQCPMCRTPMTDNLSGRVDVLQYLLTRSGKNTKTAERLILAPMVMGAATIALMAAIELSGLKGTKDILAIGGGGYMMGAIAFGAAYGTAGVELSWNKLAKFAAAGFTAGAVVGNEFLNRGFTPPTASKLEITGVFGVCGAVIGAAISPFIGKGARAEVADDHRIHQASQGAAIAATLVGTVAWFLGKTQDSPMAQIFGIVAIARSTGLIPLSIGAGIGTLTAGAIRFGQWYGQQAKEAAAATSAAMTAVVLHAQNPTCPAPQGVGISAAATRFGMTAAKTFMKMGFRNLDRTQSLFAAGMVAAIASAAGSTLLARAYQSYKRSTAAAA